MSVAAIYWDPSPDLFFLPLTGLTVRWYGVLFVTGFLLAFWSLIPKISPLFKGDRKKAVQFLDQMTWYIAGGTLIGARLGHILFYGLPHYLSHPVDILKIWEGGLASHGGAVGILIALFFFLRKIKKKHPNLHFLSLCDLIAPQAALTAACIRVGNFFNQEIIGPPTKLPWGVVFGHPVDGLSGVPRHPTQLYEAVVYVAIFLILSFLWSKTTIRERSGQMTGLFFVVTFTSRFLLEFFKGPMSLVIEENVLTMGHFLSIPFVLLGCWLIARKSENSYNPFPKEG